MDSRDLWAENATWLANAIRRRGGTEGVPAEPPQATRAEVNAQVDRAERQLPELPSFLRGDGAPPLLVGRPDGTFVPFPRLPSSAQDPDTRSSVHGFAISQLGAARAALADDPNMPIEVIAATLSLMIQRVAGMLNDIGCGPQRVVEYARLMNALAVLSEDEDGTEAD